MAQKITQNYLPLDLMQKLSLLEQRLPICEDLLKTLDRNGLKNSSRFRTLQIETDRVRSGQITLREVEAFEEMLGSLLYEFGSEIGGLPYV
jgi:hypothetical protein